MGKPVYVPFNRLHQRTGLDLVEFRKIGAQHDLVATDKAYPTLHHLSGKKLLSCRFVLGHGLYFKGKEFRRRVNVAQGDIREPSILIWCNRYCARGLASL
jgi:hypothetical protein